MNVPEIFGSNVFNETVMRERLPKDIYAALKRTMVQGVPMSLEVANVVASAMKDWAIENGATHYTHWFQPMTGITAEKHDSFIAPSGNDDGGVIMEFSGKALIKGESDASSFPSGGLRATFEARGYTAWDPTSYAFLKDGALCIPTAFCSYGGEALDMKTPLLRSMDALNIQGKRILKLLGTPCSRVSATVGLEQEYFLVDREVYNQRKDLIYTGRTLLGAKPPKGQELEDHYFGSMRMRISAFMKELDEELWRLGILAKTEHNEPAPAQHELAPIFTTTNVAVDHNQITMEIMRKVAKRHGLTCLLHEKPFAGVNGSGKQYNWSVCTDTGVNLFEPGDTPEENAQFLLFICAVIMAADEYQDLMRISVASAGNDHRLGGNEAPPAIVSMYLGDELEAILDAIKTGTRYDKVEKKQLDIGVDALPRIPRDTTDRNRTSPFAFTGNKFEFRMLGSYMSAADVNTVLNTAMAESLRRFADVLESADDLYGALNELLRDTLRRHDRIFFSGNGYDESWTKEAARRGLSNYRSTAEAVPHLLDDKNVELFERHNVMTRTELASRCEIMLESYCKQVNIEAKVLSEMIRRDVLPACLRFAGNMAGVLQTKKAVMPDLACRAESDVLSRVSALTDELYARCAVLDEAIAGVGALPADYCLRAGYYHDTVLAAMAEVRAVSDELETLVCKADWPYPSYGRILFRV